MKHTNEKKQDLLLEALSCIDDDILEKGLALRDGVSPEVRKGSSEPSGEFAPPPTFVLSELDRKPARILWRILPVVAAACLLAVVIPLSVLLAAFLLHGDNDAPLPAPGQTDEMGGLLPPADVGDGNEADGTNAWVPEEAPATEEATDGRYDEPEVTDRLPEWWEPDEQETAFPDSPYSPELWEWNVISHKNNNTEKNLHTDFSGLDVYYQYTATVDTFRQGTKEELQQFQEAELSPEDELVLDLYAQYALSLSALDYGSHFMLFHPNAVEDRFTKHIAPLTYELGVGRIRSLTSIVRPYGSVSVDVTLLENRLLTGEALEEYLANLSKNIENTGLSVEHVTEVRRFTAAGTVTLGGTFTSPFNPLGGEDGDPNETEFYCYRYDGVWYLEDTYMDDDLSLDLAESNPFSGQGYLKTQSKHGTVVDVDDSFLYLDTGHAFLIEDATILIPSGEGERSIRVGDTVIVTHYSLGLGGLSFPIEGVRTEYWSLYTATQVDVYE